VNESFLVRFKRGNRYWPVKTVSLGGGVTFDGPGQDARQMTLEFDARDNPVSQMALNRVRSLHGWHPWEFELIPEEDDGGIRFHGVDEYGLPTGYFWCRVTVQDAKVPGGKQNFEIEQDATQAKVLFTIAPDDRQVKLALTAGDDSQIDRLLAVPGSVDGESLRNWLESDVAPKRKACALNLLAALRVTPNKAAPFITLVESVFHVEPDRIYAAVQPELYARLQELADDPDRPVYAEGTPEAPIHRRLLEQLPEIADRTAGYDLFSFRAEGRPSLQAVIAVPPGGYPQRFYADLDLDLGNPLQDVQGFAIHMGELLSATQTDHLTLYKTLSATKAADFLYYSVTNA